MTYEAAMDRCSIIRDTLTSGHSIRIEPTLENIEWATMCAEAAEKQIPKRVLPTKDAVDMFEADKLLWGEGHCPNCEHYIRLPHKYCYKCGQTIDWSEGE